jgi:hypothetical protein
MAGGVGLVYGASSLRPHATSFQADFSEVPLALLGFEGREMENDPEDMAYLEADQMRTIWYGEPPDRAEVSLIYGASWRTVHTPEGCFPAQGWGVVWDRPVQIPTGDDAPHPGPLNAKLMRVERDNDAALVLFVFAHKGGTEADWTRHSWAVATGPPGAGGLSLMITAAARPGKEEEVGRRLRDLMSAIYPSAVKFWYR